MKNHARIYLWVIVWPLVLGFQTSAQRVETTQPLDRTHPLAQFLDLLPFDAVTREDYAYLEYVDIGAAIAVRPGAVTADTLTALREASRAGNRAARITTNALPSDQAGILGALSSAGVENSPGFDYFDIEQMASLVINTTVEIVALNGNFAPDTIAERMQARGYMVVEPPVDDMTMLCASGDCDDSFATSQGLPQAFHPFGGRDGKQYPIIVRDHAILSAGTRAAFHDLIRSLSNEVGLTALHSLRTLAEVFGQEETLVRLTVVSIPDGVFDVPVMFAMRDRAEAVAYAQTLRDAGILPEFQMLAFAQLADTSGERGIMAIVYDEVAQAEAAVPVLERRLEVTGPDPRLSTYRNRLERVGAIQPLRVVRSPTTGQAAVLLTVSADHPQDDDFGNPTASGKQWQTMYRMFIERDINLLVWGDFPSIR